MVATTIIIIIIIILSQCDLAVFPILLKLELCKQLCFSGHVLFSILFTSKCLSALRG